jgi:nicotinamidase-related amidase
MLTIDPKRSILLVVDFQARLMPAIHDGETAVRNANRLIEAASCSAFPASLPNKTRRASGPPSAR